jgi:hypothetical protein
MAAAVARRSRFFTPREANVLLPTLRPLLEAITREKRALDAQRATLHALQQNPDARRYDRERAAFEAQLAALQTHIEELEGHGCILRDVEQGLLDFPAERFGEPVYLCWRRGEPAVHYWHGLREGVAGRKLLERALDLV